MENCIMEKPSLINAFLKSEAAFLCFFVLVGKSNMTYNHIDLYLLNA